MSKKKKVLFLLLILFCSSIPTFAGTGDSGITVLDDTITKLQEFSSGGWVKGLFGLAIVGMGFAWFFNRDNKAVKIAFFSIVGAAVFVFGGPQISEMLFTQGALV